MRTSSEMPAIATKLKCLGPAAKAIRQLYFKLITDPYSPRIKPEVKLGWPSLWAKDTGASAQSRGYS